MGRLKTLAPRIGRLGPAVAWPDETRDQTRDATQHWRAWYKTKAWQRLRWLVLKRDLFTCQWPGCGRVEADTSQLVADHRRPHRGDAALFWDPGNLWCLCRTCHDGPKQAMERAGLA